MFIFFNSRLWYYGNMKYQTLYNGVKIPMIGVGTYRINDDGRGIDLIKYAIQSGYRLIDTAQVYFNEGLVGQAIKESGIPREEIFITTKIHFKTNSDPIPRLEESFKKLGTDYIDLVLIHWPFGDYYNAWRVLEHYYEIGKIKAIGVSNFDVPRIIDLVHFAKIPPMVNQIEVNVYAQRPEELEWFKKYNIVVQAHSPLGHGKLPNLVNEEILTRIGKKYNKTGAQISLKFLTQLGIVVLPKTSHEYRMDENKDIFDFELSEEDINEIRKLNTNDPLLGRPNDPKTIIKLLEKDD